MDWDPPIAPMPLRLHFVHLELQSLKSLDDFPFSLLNNGMFSNEKFKRNRGRFFLGGGQDWKDEHDDMFVCS